MAKGRVMLSEGSVIKMDAVARLGCMVEFWAKLSLRSKAWIDWKYNRYTREEPKKEPKS